MIIMDCFFLFLIGVCFGGELMRWLDDKWIKLVCEGLVNGRDCGDRWNKYMKEAQENKEK